MLNHLFGAIRTFFQIAFYTGSLFCSHAFAITPLDSIAIIVNDDVITKNELDNKVAYFENQIRISGGSVSDKESLKKQVIERMIRDKVQLQKAAQFGIQIDDISLNRMIDAMAKKNDMTLSELRSTLEREGMDFGDFRTQTREELIIQELQKRMVADKVNITSQEIQQFIEAFGIARTKEIFFTANTFQGKELIQKGLVDYMIPKPDLEEFTHTYAQKITMNAPLSLKGIKNIISMFENDLALNKKDLQKADQLMQRCFQSDDLKEGQTAFLEKRVPKFNGK